MGSITSLFVRKAVRAVDEGIDQNALLASIGLDPDGQINVAEIVSDSAYYDLLERIAELSAGSPCFPLKVGASMNCDDYGAFGLAWKTAPTLRESLARAERYWQLLTSVSQHEVRHDGDDAYFMLHRAGPRRLGLRMSNEATLASTVSIMRQVSPAAFSPREVHFQHPPPRTTDAHEKYFGCPVYFASDIDALLIASEDLTRCNLLGDEAITRFLLTHLDEELEKIATDRTTRKLVHDAVAQSLSSGVPKMPEIARRLGISERTLHRRLNSEGLSFQTLITEARRELAQGLLVQSDYSLAEVAFLTGFSEQSAFNRAFKRWTSATPAAYRQARQS